MRKILFGKAYQPFFLVAGISFGIALFFFGSHPGSTFDINFYAFNSTITEYGIWLTFSIYLFVLAGIYFLIGITKLKTKRWLVVAHYVFVLLFLIFFIIVSAFSNSDVQDLLSGIPLLTILTIYGVAVFTYVTLFVLGLIFLIINLFSLKKN